MSSEIKEILDYCNKYINDKYMQYSEPMLNVKSLKLLLDYITNLQEENKEWSMIFDTFSKRPYAHKYLEEKKKELGNKKIICLDSEMIYKDYYDYKSRNEKARKKLKSIRVFGLRSGKTLFSTLINETIDILDGGDDNE